MKLSYILQKLAKKAFRGSGTKSGNALQAVPVLSSNGSFASAA
jgi:hypothetical protein